MTCDAKGPTENCYTKFHARTSDPIAAAILTLAATIRDVSYQTHDHTVEVTVDRNQIIPVEMR